MNVVVVSPRYPRRGGKGDEHRTFLFIRHLAQEHSLTVVTCEGPGNSADANRLESMTAVHVASKSKFWRAGSALWATVRGYPAQVGWMAPAPFRRCARAAAGRADLVFVVTARGAAMPYNRPTVIDHVDALSLNMARRAEGSEPLPIRMFARLEARRMRAHEARVARWASAQVVSSAEDARYLPQAPRMTVVPNGWDGKDAFEDPPGHHRDIDVIFTGNMRYPPNRRAAEWVDAELFPRLRRRLPKAGVWVVGRSAASLRLRHVRVESDVEDLYSFLRRARIAVVPLNGGTGSPIKVLEAAANGAALVSRAWALAPYDMPGLVADGAEEFVDAVATLLADEGRRRALVTQSAASVRSHSSAQVANRLTTILRDVNSRDRARRGPVVRSGCDP